MDEHEITTLRELAKRHVWLMFGRNPHTEAFREALLTNAESWRLGFNEEDFYYWVAPMTADKRMVAPPSHVLHWDHHDFQAIHKHRSHDK